MKCLFYQELTQGPQRERDSFDTAYHLSPPFWLGSWVNKLVKLVQLIRVMGMTASLVTCF